MINNYEFDKTKHDDRTASQYDYNNLERLFGVLLNYELTIKSNVTKSELEDLLSKAADECRRYSHNYDALICVIMIHGAGNSIITSDNTKVTLEKLVSFFDGVLPGKAKLFIVQACRPKEKSQIVEQPVNSTRIKKEDHVFVWQSILSGALAYRNMKGILGSLFINCLVTVVTHCWYKDDLYSLLIKVNNLMSKCAEKSAQCSTLNSTATKLFVFKEIPRTES